MNTQSKIIELPGLTIDCSALRSVFADDMYSPIWSGKVTLTLIDAIAGTTNIVTANWSFDDMLYDFEGESEDPVLYEACEAYAPNWSARVIERIGRPSYWDAHQNDLADRGIIAA